MSQPTHIAWFCSFCGSPDDPCNCLGARVMGRLDRAEDLLAAIRSEVAAWGNAAREPLISGDEAMNRIAALFEPRRPSASRVGVSGEGRDSRGGRNV